MAANVRFEDFELEPGAYRLRQNDVVVRLERIPFELLCLLVERGGEMVTREEILDRVWGKGVFVDGENSINTAVRKIRRALKDDADSPRFVVTIPAKGYRFIAPVAPSNGEVKANGQLADELSQIQAPPGTAPVVEKRGVLTYLSIAAIPIFILATILFLRYLPLHLRTPDKSSLSQDKVRDLPLPNTPSIAVLPFTNLSQDPQQEYFSDGITDELTTNLSRLNSLFVIARTSSFTYKNKAAKAQDIAHELGVKYLLEGSVLKTSNRVRVDTQLVEAETGANLWAGHFDRPLADVFTVQDDIVQKIVTTLNLQIAVSEQGIRTWQHTDNIEAYDDLLRGLSLRKVSKEGNEEARQLYEKAIALDPGYLDAYYLLGCTYYIDWVWQWNSDPHILELAFANVRKAIALDDLAPYPHVLFGLLLAYQGHKDAGIAEAERGITLAPNLGFDYFWAAETMNVSGKYTKAFELLEKAMRIDPRNADNYLMQVGNAYVGLHRCKEAVAALDRFLVSQPRNVGGHFCQIVAYVECGMMEEARSEAAEVTKLSPEFSLEAGSFKGKSSRFIDDLRKAGLK